MVQVRNRKVLGWEEIYKPEVCEEMVGWEDELHMHYEATRLLFFRIPFYLSCLIITLRREDGTKFGSLVDNYPAYGPFSLSVCVI